MRVWPAKEYTRVTLELEQPLAHSHFMIEDPLRVVVDLQGIAVDSALRELVAKVIPSDPYIHQVRVGQFNPDTMRLVFDLKQAVKPQIFTLAPVAEYKHRLVIDFYPTRPPDPLDLLIAQTEAAAIMRALAADDVPGADNPRPSKRDLSRGGGRVLPAQRRRWWRAWSRSPSTRATAAKIRAPAARAARWRKTSCWPLPPA